MVSSLDSRMDLVNSIMDSINLENSSGTSSVPNSELSSRRTGSVREKRMRKQTQLHSIRKLEGTLFD
jgi:hypothetical protein